MQKQQKECTQNVKERSAGRHQQVREKTHPGPRIRRVVAEKRVWQNVQQWQKPRERERMNGRKRVVCREK